MQSLRQIIQMELPKQPRFTPDSFQAQIEQNMLLEFFLDKCRILFTPDNRFLTTGRGESAELAEAEEILRTHPEVLTSIRRQVIYNLSVYSALLETNSYYIELNNGLVICRFVPSGEGDEDHFELKLYTIPDYDLERNYGDKIYLGRDLISVAHTKREHLGLKYIRNATIDQLIKLKERLGRYLDSESLEEYQHEYLIEIEELVGEFAEMASEIIESYPVEVSSHSVEREILIAINSRFREIKHLLIEIQETVREMENRLFTEEQSHAVRYVTKFRKDVTNTVNFIMMKVNGRISDVVNGIHF